MGEILHCPHFIPLARSELIDLLCADPTFTDDDRAGFRAVCELVTAVHHLGYNRRLQQLKADYAPFDPDADTPALVPLAADAKQRRLNALYRDFAWLLDQAQFKHLGRDDIEPVLKSASDWGIRMDVDFGAFEHLAIFARGDGYQTRVRRRWRNLWRREEAEVPVYTRLVLILKLRPHPRVRGVASYDHVYLKVFKNIPKLDVMMLLPGARVRMSALDRGKIAGGFFSGVAVTVYNLFTELLHAVQHLLLSHNLLWGLAAGGLGYGYKTYYGYQQTRQAYHLTLTESLYFQNLDSNAGVLTRLLDEAEEQECRTAVLAYYCLWRLAGPQGWTSAELDTAMELYLDRYADLPLLCEEGQALAQLQKLGLLEGDGPRHRAAPPPRALEALRGAWDRHFPGSPAAAQA